MQYGKSFSAHRTYPIGLQWVVAGGDTIEDFVQDMRRRAKQCALVCVQVPWYSRSLSLLDPVALAQSAMGYAGPTSQLPAFVVPLRLPISVRTYELMSAAEWDLSSEYGGLSPPRNAFLVIFEEALVARFGFFADTAVSRVIRKKPVSVWSPDTTPRVVRNDSGAGAALPGLADRRGSGGAREHGGGGGGGGGGSGGGGVGGDGGGGGVGGCGMVPIRRRWEGALVESVVGSANWFKQYVHMSRVALVRIEPTCIAWVPWLVPAGNSAVPGAAVLLKALSDFCRALSIATEMCDELVCCALRAIGRDAAEPAEPTVGAVVAAGGEAALVPEGGVQALQ